MKAMMMKEKSDLINRSAIFFCYSNRIVGSARRAPATGSAPRFLYLSRLGRKVIGVALER